MRDQTLTLQARLRSTGWILLLIAVVGLGLGWRLLDAVDVDHAELVNGSARDLLDIDALAIALQERSANARGYLLTGDPGFLEPRREAMRAFESVLKQLRARTSQASNARVYANVAARWERLSAASDRAISARATDSNKATAIWEREARPIQTALTADLAALLVGQRSRFDEARERVRVATQQGRTALGGLALAVTLALGALLYQLARTARELIQSATRDQEQMMFRMLDQVPVGIFVVEPGGKPYYANQWSQRLLGRPADVTIDPAELMSAYAAFEAGTSNPYPLERAPVVRALQGETCEVTDMEIRRTDDVVPLIVHGGPIRDRKGEIVYAVAAFQDVRELQRAATLDPLTGLGNRRALALTFTRERLLHERSGALLAIAIVDIDHFKRVNDTYGHAVGDVVLKRTASSMIDALRRSDLVIRWGGEELVVVLPNTDIVGAHAALLKALDAVRNETFTAPGHETFSVTFSGGLVKVRSSESLDSAVARADALLYEAKRSGRNRVLAEDGSSSVPPPRAYLG